MIADTYAVEHGQAQAVAAYRTDRDAVLAAGPENGWAQPAHENPCQEYVARCRSYVFTLPGLPPILEPLPDRSSQGHRSPPEAIMSRSVLATVAAFVLIVGVMTGAMSRSRIEARQASSADTCATIEAQTQTATVAATLAPSVRPSFAPPQFDPAGNLILPTFATVHLGAACVNGVMIRDEAGNILLPPVTPWSPPPTVRMDTARQTGPLGTPVAVPTRGWRSPGPCSIPNGTVVGLPIVATAPLAYSTTAPPLYPQSTAPSWGMDCSVRPWDADCGEPMETSAELASTAESLLSHEPTPDPWDTGP